MCNELTIRNKTKKLKINLRLFKELLLCALDELKEQSYIINIILVNSKEIEKLNNQYLNHIGVTDVISFEYSKYEENHNGLDNETENPEIWGDVVICPEVAIQNAAKFKTTVSKEIIRYAIHGILHLKGYNDETPEEQKLMRKMENTTITHLKRKYNIEELLIA